MKNLRGFIVGSVLVLATVLLMAQAPPRGPLAGSLKVPAGVVVPFAGPAPSVPAGWLLCDGSEISRADFAKLFAVLGTRHGEGDGSTTFNLPDYRGQFLRGVDHGTGLDPDSAARVAMAPGGNDGDNVGSIQLDSMQSHHHSDSFFGRHGHNVSMAPDIHEHKIFRSDGFPAPIKFGGGGGGSGNIVENSGGGPPPPLLIAERHFHRHDAIAGEAQSLNRFDPLDSGTGAGTPRHGMETRSTNAYVNWMIKE